MAAASPQPAPRARDLGLSPGVLPPGERNAITDVPGVRVGHATIVRGDAIRTGVTAILPHEGNLFQHKAPAGVFVANAFGKAAGLLQIQELGNLETPIILTNTLSVGVAVEAVIRWTLSQPGNEAVRSVNAVVGETNDGFLNDIRAMQVTRDDVIAAIEAAQPGDVAEGAVGAGTGTVCMGWKGGIGTASRALPGALGGYTVGVLVQTNYSGVLTMDGIPVGESLGQFDFREQLGNQYRPSAASGGDEGSVIVVIATDAPAGSRNLERMARRAPLGLARTGSYISNGSGDFVIAFSTRNLVPHVPGLAPLQLTELPNDAMNPLFLAVVEAVEEAVYNSLIAATTTTGRDGRVVESLPLDVVRDLITRRDSNLSNSP